MSLKNFLVLGMASLFSCTGFAGEHCGTQGTLLGYFFSHIVVPEYFPPENSLLRSIFGLDEESELGQCEQWFMPIHLGASCELHDQCYGSEGAIKDTCDENLYQGWKVSCIQGYNYQAGALSEEASQICGQMCLEFVQFMFEAMRYDDGFFCPSCIAFERSQMRLRDEEMSLQ